MAAGGYPAAEAFHLAGDGLPVKVVPPGVDVDRFRPLSAEPEAPRPGPPPACPVDGPLVVGHEPAGAP